MRSPLHPPPFPLPTPPAAASPGASGRHPSIARRLLGGQAIIIGGGGGFGLGGGVRNCVGAYMCNQRAQTAQTLATLNAQSAIGIAASGNDLWSTFGATQSAQRGAIAATQGNIPYVANQVAFDSALNPSSPYGLFSPANRISPSYGRRR
jgi:hypothetical protein